MTFPDDDNGDVLRRMFEGGDSLKQARDIDFAHRFVHGRAAETFAALAGGAGLQISIQDVEDAPETSWDVIVTANMIPDHQAIGAFERRLADQAERLGGQADGWGCFRIIDQPAID